MCVCQIQSPNRAKQSERKSKKCTIIYLKKATFLPMWQYYKNVPITKESEFSSPSQTSTLAEILLDDVTLKFKHKIKIY